MRRFVLYFLFAVLLTGCRRAEYSAEYKIPETDLALGVELKQINAPLAEYERSLIVSRAGLVFQRVALSADIGGYSLLNLYKLSSGEYVLDYDGNPYYRIDPTTGTVHAKLRGIPIGEPDRPLRETYIGAFDFDHHYVWQFFPASQRAERKVELPYAP